MITMIDVQNIAVLVFFFGILVKNEIDHNKIKNTLNEIKSVIIIKKTAKIKTK